MFRIPTHAKLALATLAVAASAGPAIAGEGNGPSFPGNDVPDVILGQTATLPAQAGPGGVVIGGKRPPVHQRPGRAWAEGSSAREDGARHAGFAAPAEPSNVLGTARRGRATSRSFGLTDGRLNTVRHGGTARDAGWFPPSSASRFPRSAT